MTPEATLDEEFAAACARYRKAIEERRAGQNREVARLLDMPVEDVTAFHRGVAAGWFSRPDLVSAPSPLSSPAGAGDDRE